MRERVAASGASLMSGLSRAQRAASETTSLSFVRLAADPSSNARLDGIVLADLANVSVADVLEMAAIKRRLAELTAENERLKAAVSLRHTSAASAPSRAADASLASAAAPRSRA